LISCSEKENKIPVLDYNNKPQLLQIVQKNFIKDVQVVFGGMFDKTGKQFIAAGWEVNGKDEWGIKFAFLQQEGNNLVKKFETDLLDGSLKESLNDKIKFSSFDYELLYYNSSNYFLGSGGGEVFTYILDFQNKQVYYAHLVASEKSNSLFISDNTVSKELRNFFSLLFKKDYSNLKVVKDDIVAE
jgi:hypothetical protein